jgi:hypothetical protein
MLTIGLAATASVGLAACYGAPSRYREHHAPNDRERNAWLVYEPSAEILERVEANAMVQCEQTREYETLVVRCADIELAVTGHGDRVEVECRRGTRKDCVELFDQLRAEVPASDAGAAPIEEVGTAM